LRQNGAERSFVSNAVHGGLDQWFLNSSMRSVMKFNNINRIHQLSAPSTQLPAELIMVIPEAFIRALRSDQFIRLI
jgi:hypothetical protein